MIITIMFTAKQSKKINSWNSDHNQYNHCKCWWLPNGDKPNKTDEVQHVLKHISLSFV